MRSGAAGTDAYLAEWRRVAAGDADGAPDDTAARIAARIDAAYDGARLKHLIDNNGWA
jgi:hypothetical protein